MPAALSLFADQLGPGFHAAHLDREVLLVESERVLRPARSTGRSCTRARTFRMEDFDRARRRRASRC